MNLKHILLTLNTLAVLTSSLSQGNTPCTATSLTVGSSCSYTSGTTVGATFANNGFGAPSCSAGSSPDVWYTFVAPAGAYVTISLTSGTMTDSEMALYSRSTNCSTGTVTELECDDDSGPGDMSEVVHSGLTVGETYYVRIWDYLGGTGTFNICAKVTAAPTNITCNLMKPICSGSATIFTAQANGSSAAVGPNFDCLITQPNPSWYYLEIDNPGKLSIDITADNDVDFAIWGSYNTLASAKASCATYPLPIDCSFDPSSIENAVVNGTVNGKFYVLLVTNYSDVTQIITINQAADAVATTNCSIVLPIELVSFDAKIIDNSVHLIWKTASEINNDYFLVQRSKDGSIWETISIKKSQGTSHIESAYELIDANPVVGISYYRLKQVDTNGEFTYSAINSVNNISDLDISMYPIPTKDELTINAGKEIIDLVQLSDLLGNNIDIPFSIINNEYLLNTSQLKKGLYTVIMTINGKKTTRKLIKS